MREKKVHYTAKLALWLMVLLLFSMPETLLASRHGPDAVTKCLNEMKMLQGQAEMIRFDHKPCCFSERVNAVDQKLLSCIIEKYGRGDSRAILDLQKNHGCKHYIINIEGADILAICHQHSGYSRGADKSISPYEVFAEFVSNHGESPDRFDLALNKKPYSMMMGSIGLQLFARFWYLLLFLPFVYFARIKHNIAESGIALKVYVAGTCVVSFLYILSLISIIYTGSPFIIFRMRLSAGVHYPQALVHLANVFMVAAPAWWLISLAALLAMFSSKNSYLQVPLTYVLVNSIVWVIALVPGEILPMPAGEMITMILSLVLLPGFGIYMAVVLANARYCSCDE